MSNRISDEAVHRAAEIASKGGGGNSEQEHRAFAAEARRMDREASESPREIQKSEANMKRLEVKTTIRH